MWGRQGSRKGKLLLEQEARWSRFILTQETERENKKPDKAIYSQSSWCTDSLPPARLLLQKVP